MKKESVPIMSLSASKPQIFSNFRVGIESEEITLFTKRLTLRASIIIASGENGLPKLLGQLIKAAVANEIH